MQQISKNVTLLLLLTICTQAQTARKAQSGLPPAPSFITIDYPGALATFPSAVNNLGAVVGYYSDRRHNTHGFLLRNGVYQNIDHPNSGFNAANGINDSGLIVGTYFTSYQQGYLQRNGEFTIINFGFEINYAAGINAAGDFVGVYDNTCCDLHGYLYTRDRIFTALDYPGAMRTLPDGINSARIIVGSWLDASSVFHGFIWNAGVFTPIDVPNATGTFPFSISSSNVVAGYFRDSPFGAHGFLFRNGQFETVDFPGAKATFVLGMNDAEMVVGIYVDASGAKHGFVGHK